MGAWPPHRKTLPDGPLDVEAHRGRAYRQRRVGGLRREVVLLLVGVAVALLVARWVVASCLVSSGSMEGTLRIGDVVLVAKIPYGVRLLGLKRIRRGDVVVFDGGGEKGRRQIKRVLGMPGDVVRYKGSELWVNGSQVALQGTMKRAWVVRVRPGGRLDQATLYRLGITEVYARNRDSSAYVVGHAGAEVMAGVAAWPDVEDISPCDDCSPWQAALWLPRQGERVRFTADNAAALAKLINRHERHKAEVLDGVVCIDGEPAPSFRFSESYYFVVGDNRDASIDSRVWGAVPERGVVGRAVVVYFSWDPIRRVVRWDRLGRAVS